MVLLPDRPHDGRPAIGSAEHALNLIAWAKSGLTHLHDIVILAVLA